MLTIKKMVFIKLNKSASKLPVRNRLSVNHVIANLIIVCSICFQNCICKQLLKHKLYNNSYEEKSKHLSTIFHHQENQN